MYFVFKRAKQRFLLNRNAEEHFWSYVESQECPSWTPQFHGSLGADLCTYYLTAFVILSLSCFPKCILHVLPTRLIWDFQWNFQSLGFSIVCSVPFIYTEATYLLSKEFPEPKLREVVEVTLQDVGQTLWILYSVHHETYGTIHLGNHSPWWSFTLPNSTASSLWH